MWGIKVEVVFSVAICYILHITFRTCLNVSKHLRPLSSAWLIQILIISKSLLWLIGQAVSVFPPTGNTTCVEMYNLKKQLFRQGVIFFIFFLASTIATYRDALSEVNHEQLIFVDTGSFRVLGSTQLFKSISSSFSTCLQWACQYQHLIKDKTLQAKNRWSLQQCVWSSSLYLKCVCSDAVIITWVHKEPTHRWELTENIMCY